MIFFIIQMSHRLVADARCIDCGIMRGMRCCKLGNGTEYCAFPEDCPVFDKENGIRTTSEEKSFEDNENDIEINLNINLNGPSEKKMASGRPIPGQTNLGQTIPVQQKARTGDSEDSQDLTEDVAESLDLPPLLHKPRKLIPKPNWGFPRSTPKTSAGGLTIGTLTDSSNEQSDGMKCCREKGVLDVCLGYCSKENEIDHLNTDLLANHDKLMNCEEWFKQIGQCRKDDPKDCEIVDCTIDWVVNLCPKTCALKPKKLNRCEEDICNCVDCSKPRSSQVCPLACPASTKDATSNAAEPKIEEVEASGVPQKPF